jgi:hypothetical protein
MTMLDELCDELARRGAKDPAKGWPAPASAPGAVYWSGVGRMLLVTESLGLLCIVYRRATSVWRTAAEAADELERLRARLAPGEMPCLERALDGERLVDGVRIVGPDA